MGKLIKMQSSDMIVRELSPEMVKIEEAIEGVTKELEDYRTRLDEKQAVLEHASAGRLLSPQDKSSQVVEGKSRRIVSDLTEQIAKSERTLAGLESHMQDATAREQQRLFGELQKLVRQDGRRLLELIDKLRLNIMERNRLLTESKTVMERCFWHNDIADLNKYLGTSIMLPAPLDPVKDPFDRPCGFLDRLKMLIGEDDKS